MHRSSAILLATLALLVGACGGDDDDAQNSAEENATTTTVAVADTGERTCVALVDPLPEGAPEVPVPEGPPPTELVVEDLAPGDGAEVVAGSTVTVDYIGVACSTGAIFDSSYANGQPIEFGLEQVIAGWSEGLLGMKVGGRRLLGIPPELAYGEAGFPPAIGPGETLWFVVELHGVA